MHFDRRIEGIKVRERMQYRRILHGVHSVTLSPETFPLFLELQRNVFHKSRTISRATTCSENIFLLDKSFNRLISIFPLFFKNSGFSEHKTFILKVGWFFNIFERQLDNNLYFIKLVLTFD